MEHRFPGMRSQSLPQCRVIMEFPTGCAELPAVSQRKNLVLRLSSAKSRCPGTGFDSVGSP